MSTMGSASTSASSETRSEEPRATRRRARRVSTETKASFKTTEFVSYLAAVVAVAIAAQVIGDDSGAGDGGDYFRADKAFLYIVILTVGYMVSRGLAKSGSRDFYDDEIDLRDHSR